MKNIFLFILLLLTIMSLLYNYNYKESLQNYTLPADINPEHSYNTIYKDMLKINDNKDNVLNDIKYFNNASNLMFGYSRIPDIP